MKTIFIILLSTFMLQLSTYAKADQPIPMIRTLCISDSEIQHFSAHIEDFNRLADYIHFPAKGDKNTHPTKKKRIDYLKKQYGILYTLTPEGYNFTCTLGASVYKIYGYRPPLREKGMCGGNPRIVLTLEKNGKPVLDKVFFEPSCLLGYKPAHIVSFSIDETTQDSYGIESVIVSNGEKRKSLRSKDLKEVVTQSTLDNLVKLRFFDSP